MTDTLLLHHATGWTSSHPCALLPALRSIPTTHSALASLGPCGCGKQVRQFLPSFITGFSVRMEAQKLGGTLASRKAGAVCIGRGAQRMEKNTLLSLNTRAAPQPGRTDFAVPALGALGHKTWAGGWMW